MLSQQTSVSRDTQAFHMLSDSDQFLFPDGPPSGFFCPSGKKMVIHFLLSVYLKSAGTISKIAKLMVFDTIFI